MTSPQPVPALPRANFRPKAYTGYLGGFDFEHKHPPKPFNPAARADAAALYARVTASMVADDFYASHDREACKAEWARRYEAFAAASRA